MRSWFSKSRSWASQKRPYAPAYSASLPLLRYAGGFPSAENVDMRISDAGPEIPLHPSDNGIGAAAIGAIRNRHIRGTSPEH